jgi:2-methylisocitrate lyase-like PEP mutase family enzyme
MTQSDKARAFAALHTQGAPLVLYNIWDAGSAKAVTAAGATAIATGSWSVAAAQGFEDGEAMPMAFALQVLERITAATELPVTVDFEGGYAEDPRDVADNAEKVMTLGAVGINFEDQIVGGSGLYDTATQCARIRAIRDRAEAVGLPLFINARTDLFLKADDSADMAALAEEAAVRAAAYAQAGASGFFAPALKHAGLIRDLCAASPIPVNVMMMDGVPPVEDLATLGVSRISFGPGPYIQAMQALREATVSATG